MSSSWISAFEGQVVSVEPLSDLLPRESGACAPGAREVVALFQKPDPKIHQQALEQEIERARHQTAQQVQDSNKRELDVLSERFSSSIAKLENAVLGIEKVVASEVVDLALLVAGEIVKREMNQNPDVLVETVGKALADLPHDGKVLVRLHPADLESVRESQSNAQSVLEYQADATLFRGDTILETPTRIIDASIDARLAAVRDSLVRVLMTEESRADEEDA